MGQRQFQHEQEHLREPSRNVAQWKSALRGPAICYMREREHNVVQTGSKIVS